MLVFVAVLFGAGAAKAADSPPDARSTGIGLGVGGSSTISLLGLTLTRAFGRHFQIEVAGSAGLFGTRLALMPKIVIGAGRDRYVGGIGVARVVPPARDHCCQVDGSPTWLIVDAVAYEHRWDNGLALGFALGPVLGLGGGRVCYYVDGCSESDLHDVAGVWKGHARLVLAYWF
jgi:hypothetical protein